MAEQKVGKGLLWVELCPPKRYIEVFTPQNVTRFGNRFVVDVISKDELILESGGP